MYYGKMTDELDHLYDEYYEIFHGYPDELEDIEYGQDDYAVYVKDIKKAIQAKRELPYVANVKKYYDW